MTALKVAASSANHKLTLLQPQTLPWAEVHQDALTLQTAPLLRPSGFAMLRTRWYALLAFGACSPLNTEHPLFTAPATHIEPSRSFPSPFSPNHMDSASLDMAAESLYQHPRSCGSGGAVGLNNVCVEKPGSYKMFVPILLSRSLYQTALATQYIVWLSLYSHE